MESCLDRSPEDVLRVTKEGLVKQRIQQFNRVPSLDTLSQISEENCNMRRRTIGNVELRRKLTFANLSVPHRSSTVTRPHSTYITNTRISKIGLLNESILSFKRYFNAGNFENRNSNDLLSYSNLVFRSVYSSLMKWKKYSHKIPFIALQ